MRSKKMFFVVRLCYFSPFCPLICTKKERAQSWANLVMRIDQQLSIWWRLEGKGLQVQLQK